MERRDDVLRQALNKNADETDRWQAFKADNESAIANLDMFSKKLSVEVMVPIGKKALMPGELIHTNELLVGHYQGYFSACSAHKAKEICQHRLRLAEEQLKKLGVEAELWQNKLEKPLLEGAVPNAGEIEIVEDYNEEAHNNWLKAHKESMRKQKQEERIQRASQGNDQELFQKLEEREMLEELGLDPDNLNEHELSELLQKDEDVKKPKSENKDCDKQVEQDMTDEEVFNILDKLEAEELLEEDDELNEEAAQNVQSANELVQNLMKGQGIEVTPVKTRIGKVQPEIEEIQLAEEEEDDDDDGDQPEEVKVIREQLVQLPNEQQLEFLQEQIEIIKTKMRNIQKEQFISDELTHLMNVVVCLEDDLQEIMMEQVETASTDELTDEPQSMPAVVDKKKRRISFAKEDYHVLFRKEEAVDKMMRKYKKLQPKVNRDVISLDDAPMQEAVREVAIVEPPKPVIPSPIMQKVEQNLEFVQQHQSVQDFDLVNQILEASTGKINTLHISFKHSDATTASSEFDGTTPGNPADFYLYEKAQSQKTSGNEFPIYVNSFEGEEELKVPILKEEARQAAYDDPRSQFSNPAANLEALETKSILRNKSAVERETHNNSAEESQPIPMINRVKRSRNRKQKKQRTIDDDLRDMSAYQKVMQDLVEKEPSTIPEPLPEGNYIDAHAPKQRISRFKEQRNTNRS
ncbi:unconventional prefoldin RPB5 interactor-like protein [Drosophila albomicans]|uniref:Unconventional prefoldin RPB5 interactor-like protein n=1 Tax=Drosophila albomicans TaxID=7291 RepID=A0A6P8WWL9_DROAB|nr:unconventional prefoldin RPB5 interactor-like protein [Drosophila albomicans]